MDRQTARKLTCGQKCYCGAPLWLSAIQPHQINPVYICHYECQCGNKAEVSVEFGNVVQVVDAPTP